MSGKAAPDVDLKAQGGLDKQYLIGGVTVVLLILYNYLRVGKSAEPLGDIEEDPVEVGWAVFLLGWLLKICQWMACVILVILGALVTQQRKIIYVPAPPGAVRPTAENPGAFKSPECWGLPYENVVSTSEDGTKVSSWFIYQSLSKCGAEAPYTLLYFHGNAGNIGHRLENIRDMHAKLKVNILILDYRGYGDSEDGDGPNQKGFSMDAMGLYKWLVEAVKSGKFDNKTKISLDRILFFGRSIGGAVAIQLMADLLAERMRTGQSALPLPAGLVLENTFTALRDMAVQLFPFLTPLKFLLARPLLFDPWDSKQSLEFLTQRHSHWCCCLLSGMKDEIVPPEQMTALHELLKKNRPQTLRFFRFPHGGHNDTPTRGGPDYWISFNKFMADVVATEADRRQGLEELDKKYAVSSDESTTKEE